MKAKDVIDLHTAIAKSMGCQVDSEGRLFSDDDSHAPIVVDKRQYILPTQSYLKEGGDEYLPFYLLGENIATSESQVLQKTRALMVHHLTVKISELMLHFVSLGMSNNDHQAQLSPRQKEVLKYVKGADQTTFDNLVKIVENISIKGQRMLIKAYQKFQGSLSGTTYSRICSVSFPILDELDEAQSKKNKVFGVTCRVMDIKMYTDLMYYILGTEAGEDGHFSRGSNDLTAPYFASLSLSFFAVAQQLNSRLKRYGLDTINVDWEDELSNLSAYRGLIPNGLEGTEGIMDTSRVTTSIQRPRIALQDEAYSGGAVSTKAPEDTQTLSTNRTVVETPNNRSGYGTYQPRQYVPEPQIVYQTQAPVVHHAPAPSANGKISWAERQQMKRAEAHHHQQMQQQRQQVPQYVNQPIYQTHQAPQVVYQNQPQQAAPQFVQTGVDPRSGAPVFQQIAPQQVYQAPAAPVNHGSNLIHNTDPNVYFHQPAPQPVTHQQTYGTYYAPQKQQSSPVYYGAPATNVQTPYYGG